MQAMDELPAYLRPVLLMLSKRASNREIAQTLFLSEGTVKQYVRRLGECLEVEPYRGRITRARIVATARRRGWL